MLCVRGEGEHARGRESIEARESHSSVLLHHRPSLRSENDVQLPRLQGKVDYEFYVDVFLAGEASLLQRGGAWQ